MPNPQSREAAFWNAALEAYHLDRVQDAMDHVIAQGVGEAAVHVRWYRLIEAEALLRGRGRIIEVNRWLALETVASETMGAEKSISNCLLAAADRIANRLHWRHESKVLVSILCRESETAWAISPHGYWIGKEPYDKIVLPAYLLDDEADLSRAMAHEYAHVICGGLSDEQAPAWLHEAVCTYAEFVDDAPAGDLGGTSEIDWLSPNDLETLLDNEDHDNSNEVLMGYEQCAWIGRYLTFVNPDGLHELLREHTNESVGKNLVRLLKGQDRIDTALYHTYGKTVVQLFEEANRFRIAAFKEQQSTAPKGQSSHA